MDGKRDTGKKAFIPWTPDNSQPKLLTLDPGPDDRLYDTDGPDLPGGAARTSETYNNFRQWVEWAGHPLVGLRVLVLPRQVEGPEGHPEGSRPGLNHPSAEALLPLSAGPRAAGDRSGQDRPVANFRRSRLVGACADFALRSEAAYGPKPCGGDREDDREESAEEGTGQCLSRKRSSVPGADAFRGPLENCGVTLSEVPVES